MNDWLLDLGIAQVTLSSGGTDMEVEFYFGIDEPSYFYLGCDGFWIPEQ